ncbi:membrane-associated protein, putative [Bodo saltans]|uniref:Membrane-associated protein, putative n=1 Tax=Bodo saltans TaxID=75058 RepID=A0A0S4J003_BODSA|nr:membrane-associated protein, putative [Bodo saltans]|eukprot:CUG68579.1 membrane-associated protein, putative [Bodo saltans]
MQLAFHHQKRLLQSHQQDRDNLCKKRKTCLVVAAVVITSVLLIIALVLLADHHESIVLHSPPPPQRREGDGDLYIPTRQRVKMNKHAPSVPLFKPLAVDALRSKQQVILSLTARQANKTVIVPPLPPSAPAIPGRRVLAILGRGTLVERAVIPLPGDQGAPYTNPPPLHHDTITRAMKSLSPWVFIPRHYLRRYSAREYMPKDANEMYPPPHENYCAQSTATGGGDAEFIDCYRVKPSAFNAAPLPYAEAAACDWIWGGKEKNISIESVNFEVLQVPPSIQSSVAAFTPPCIRTLSPTTAAAALPSNATAFDRAIFNLRVVTFQAEDGRPAGARIAVRPMGCLSQQYHTQIQHNKKPPVIALLGHSHQRLMGAMLCMMWNLTSCHLFKKMLSMVVQTPTSEDHLTARHEPTPWGSPPVVLTFVRAPGDVTLRLGSSDSPKWTNAVGADSAASVPDMVVYGRGAWDLVFWGTLPGELIADMTKSFVAIHRALPSTTRLVVYLLHYTQPIRRSGPRRGQRGYHPWQKVLREMCLSEERTQAVRLATLCAIKAAIRQLDDLSGLNGREGAAKGSTLRDRIEIFDVFHETSLVPSSWVKPLTDYGGHHYLDVLLEAMTQKFLRRHICPTDGLKHHHTVDQYLEAASDEVCSVMLNCTARGPCLAEMGWGGSAPLDHCACKSPRRVERFCSKY